MGFHIKRTLQQRKQLIAKKPGHGCFQYGTKNEKKADDIVIVGMARTAVTKAKIGLQKDTTKEEMLIPVLQDLVKQSGVKYEDVNDICIGHVVSDIGRTVGIRGACFMAGFPVTTTFYTLNRFCSSGFQAVIN